MRGDGSEMTRDYWFFYDQQIRFALDSGVWRRAEAKKAWLWGTATETLSVTADLTGRPHGMRS